MSTWFSDSGPVDSVAIDDRALHYGDGLFETIAIRQGRARLLDWHIERLAVGCDRLGLVAPEPENLGRLIIRALEESEVDGRFAIAKVIVSAGSGPRGYQRPTDLHPGVFIGVFAAKALPEQYYREGVATRSCRTRLGRQPQLAGIKSLNRLEQVLARAEWSDEQIFEGLMSDTEDLLICGTMSNVFIVKDDRLATPSLTYCGVSGIMRRQVIKTAAALDLECEVRDVATGELDAADELFISNSQFGVLPICQHEGLQWQPGRITAKIMRGLAGEGIAECSI